MIRLPGQIIPTVFVYNERHEMRNRLIAGLLASAVLGGISAIPAEAACKATRHCYGTVTKSTYSTKQAATHKRHGTVKTASRHTGKRVHVAYGTSRAHSLKRSQRQVAALAIPAATSGSQANVISLIKAMAPSQGVPTWFALRIAHVESNYNPHMRGRAGEYGVFQMKCSTAKDIGFRGNCGALLDPRTNVQWGLRHLALAIGKSDGNLRLAASKHNGGLGRRTVVASYVAKVF